MRRFTEMMGRDSGLVGATACTALSFSPAMQMLKHEPHSIMPAEFMQHITDKSGFFAARGAYALQKTCMQM